MIKHKRRDEYEQDVTITVGPPTGRPGEPHCTLDKSLVKVRYGGTVTFRFKEERPQTRLIVFFPTPEGERPPFPEITGLTLDVPPEGRTLKVLAKGRGRKGPLDYPYALYSREHKMFAKGSLPRMMVGP
jgi:hypothetical protein